MSYCLSCLTHRPDDKSLPRPISLSLFHFSASHRPTSHRATSPIRILGGAPVDLTGWGSRPRFAVNDASTRNNRHQMVQRQMVQRQMSTGMLVGNIGRENPLASEKRACADEKRALRQEGGKIKPHRNRRACPDAVGVDKNHAEKLLPPLVEVSIIVWAFLRECNGARQTNRLFRDSSQKIPFGARFSSRCV